MGEREFLIAPEYDQALMTAAGIHGSESRSKATKTFDWMTDDTFRNIQVHIVSLLVRIRLCENITR